MFSDMSSEQLQAEMDKLRDQGQAAFDEERWSEYEVLMKRWYLAKSYLIVNTFHPEIGKMYALTEERDTITVTKTKGVMAWGIRASNGMEEAVPLAMLTDAETE